MERWTTWNGLAVRTQRTVGIADPTVTVTWRVYGSEPNGAKMPRVYVETTECWNVYHGVFQSNDHKFDLTEDIAKVQHEAMEKLYDEHLEAMDADPLGGRPPVG